MWTVQLGEPLEGSSGSDGVGMPSRKERRGLVRAAGNDLRSSPALLLSTILLRTEPQLRASIKSRLILKPLKSRQVKKVQMGRAFQERSRSSFNGEEVLARGGEGSDGCGEEESGTHPCPFSSHVSGFSSSWNPKDSLNNNKSIRLYNKL